MGYKVQNKSSTKPIIQYKNKNFEKKPKKKENPSYMFWTGQVTHLNQNPAEGEEPFFILPHQHPNNFYKRLLKNRWVLGLFTSHIKYSPLISLFSTSTFKELFICIVRVAEMRFVNLETPQIWLDRIPVLIASG